MTADDLIPSPIYAGIRSGRSLVTRLRTDNDCIEMGFDKYRQMVATPPIAVPGPPASAQSRLCDSSRRVPSALNRRFAVSPVRSMLTPGRPPCTRS